MRRSTGAVRSLQFRAVRALKEILEEGGYFHV
jgi:DNA-directed RNA polymerase specialized sigma24 family protein